MIQRCTVQTNAKYALYGGRGINVCQRWRSFDNFLSDMGEKPTGTTIDRRDNNGNYQPGNCRWATANEQARNTRKFRLTDDVVNEICGRLEHNEPPASIARRMGLCKTSVHNAVNRDSDRYAPMDPEPYLIR